MVWRALFHGRCSSGGNLLGGDQNSVAGPQGAAEPKIIRKIKYLAQGGRKRTPVREGREGIAKDAKDIRTAVRRGRKGFAEDAEGFRYFLVFPLSDLFCAFCVTFASSAYGCPSLGVGACEPEVNARRMLDLDQPALQWTHLATGMGVEAARATTADQFCHSLRAALSRKGPLLIEAVT
jgi:hypothetical protein